MKSVYTKLMNMEQRGTTSVQHVFVAENEYMSIRSFPLCIYIYTYLYIIYYTVILYDTHVHLCANVDSI